MSVIQPLSQVGAPVIRAKAVDVALPLTEVCRQTITDLIDTLRSTQLVGLAAPQIGRSVRIFITELKETEFRKLGNDPLRVFVNPEIIALSEECNVGYEGCGSVAHSGLFGEVSRARAVTVRYHDENGQLHENTFEDFVARIIQHEFDHIEGAVFLDRLTTTLSVKSASEFKKATS